jgi:hypothetical protein
VTTKRTIPLEGLPEKYSADAVASTIRTSLGVVEEHLEAIGAPTPLARAASSRPSRYDDVRRISLTYQSGTYGGAADPRVALPTVQGVGLSADGYTQRFRFDVGTELRPFTRFAIRDIGWLHQHTMAGDFGAYASFAGIPLIGFGALVPHIRHDLGRIPEFCIRRGSSSRQGPVGQLVVTTGGASLLTVGTKIRCLFDFIPLFGITAQDIELQLKSLLTFTGADHNFDDLGGLLPDASFMENPTVLKGYASDLVTTEDHFGGLLVATTWGLPTLQAIAAGANMAIQAAGYESAQAWTRDGLTTLLDQNAVIAVREFGSLYGMRLAGAGALSALQSAGLKLGLTRGSVDFVLE